MSRQNIVVNYETNSHNDKENNDISWFGKYKLSLFRAVFYAFKLEIYRLTQMRAYPKGSFKRV